MLLRDLQHRAVDAIKAHALALALPSRRARARILTEYLWIEEGAESTALHRATGPDAPAWVQTLVDRQLADERRHARLLRELLAGLGTEPPPPPALARAKLWWLERACAPYRDAFSAGPIVALLAAAAQLEATGVRMFARHLAVLEARERATGSADPTAAVMRAILADERRHAKSCAAAARKLVRADERDRFEAMRARIAAIDRAFGVTMALGFWLLIAGRALRDRAVIEPAQRAEAA
ncbi:MAG: hypothetical protein K8W52_21210 [Deltaproteobacteria bacterium]|nr:hypothetical protein [Deltaproteobacteria bacterium]